MEKKIEQYLHLYNGCEVLLGDPNWKRSDISPADRAPYTDPDYGKPVMTKLDFPLMQHFASMKGHLLLRPLSDMTEEEQTEVGEIERDVMDDFRGQYIPKEQEEWTHNAFPEAAKTFYLLSKGFDLFGLIDSGLAIDKTK